MRSQTGRPIRKGNNVYKSLKEAFATQEGANGPTAKGYLVPIENVPGVIPVPAGRYPVWESWSKDLPSDERGRRAVGLIVRMLAEGRMPLFVNGHDDTRRSVQLSGTDIAIVVNQKIQVKCDYDAGPKTIPGCTGNLFIQTAERNPFGLH